MRYLALDLGSRTLGIAISDRSGLIASPYKVIKHKENYKSLIPLIKEIAELEKVAKIILGLPKNMNNTLGEKAQLSISFKESLEKALNLEVILEDERLTTKLAEATLLEANRSRSKRKELIDAVAAQIILQSYLDRKGVSDGK